MTENHDALRRAVAMAAGQVLDTEDWLRRQVEPRAPGGGHQLDEQGGYWSMWVGAVGGIYLAALHRGDPEIEELARRWLAGDVALARLCSTTDGRVVLPGRRIIRPDDLGRDIGVAHLTNRVDRLYDNARRAARPSSGFWSPRSGKGYYTLGPMACRVLDEESSMFAGARTNLPPLRYVMGVHRHERGFIARIPAKMPPSKVRRRGKMVNGNVHAVEVYDDGPTAWWRRHSELLSDRNMGGETEWWSVGPEGGMRIDRPEKKEPPSAPVDVPAEPERGDDDPWYQRIVKDWL